MVPDDRRPSYVELAAENAALRETIEDLQAIVRGLRAEVAELRRRLDQDSSNSSKPPSWFTKHLKRLVWPLIQLIIHPPYDAPSRKRPVLSSDMYGKLSASGELATLRLAAVRERAFRDVSNLPTLEGTTGAPPTPANEFVAVLRKAEDEARDLLDELAAERRK